MLRKIRVYGKLAKFLGKRVFEAEISSAAEAVRFLLANFPQLEPHMAQQHYRVSVGGYDLALDELHDPSGIQEVSLTPVIVGAGGAAGKILAGVALIALSFGIGAIASAGVALGGLAGIGTVATYGVGIGVSLVLGGVSQLLTPTPVVPKENKDPRKSFSFSGIQNTSRQGLPLPLVFGETIVGSVVVSAGIDVSSVKK